MEQEIEAIDVTPAEFRDYLVYHSQRLSMHDLKVLAERMPSLREAFPATKTSKFPHTPARLEFLADVVEAFVAGKCDELPLQSAAEAAFAIIYLHQEMDLIPDSIPEIGFDDDATMIALVFERNYPALRKFCSCNKKNWRGLAVSERGVVEP